MIEQDYEVPVFEAGVAGIEVAAGGHDVPHLSYPSSEEDPAGDVHAGPADVDDAQGVAE